ncbi:hypothetical protein PI124_g1307 [Phytophthora idaei]|nr:hypothetical protein PI125_g5649 [Phytophthora idaei]KAG3173546.1 hypothetical protein PI126_g825 [Phytophthora idaei]KAG3254153.1 hypothetical protein PI124_g1307 [Phytophthora idaei]
MPRPSSRQHLESVLLMLQERDNSRRQELEEYPRVAEESPASQSPIYDGFVAEGGGDAILRLTNFTPRELNTLWMSRHPILERWTWVALRLQRQGRAVCAARRDEEWRNVGDAIQHFPRQNAYVYRDHYEF